jgi:hypothetical protein
MLTGMHGPTVIFWANLTPFSVKWLWLAESWSCSESGYAYVGLGALFGEHIACGTVV